MRAKPCGCVDDGGATRCDQCHSAEEALDDKAIETMMGMPDAEFNQLVTTCLLEKAERGEKLPEGIRVRSHSLN